MSQWRDTFLALSGGVTHVTHGDTWTAGVHCGANLSPCVTCVTGLIRTDSAALGLSPAAPEQAADEAADRAAIAAEPLLPAPGTAEREAMRQRQAATIAGLLAGFAASRPRSRKAPG